MKKIKALHACNGGGKPMTVGKVYDVPDKDAFYLVNSKKAELVEAKVVEAAPETDGESKAPPPPPGGKGLTSKNGPK